MSQYRRCYLCGDILDFGERCDCKERAQDKKAFWKSRVNISKQNGQGSFNFEPERKVV